MTRQPDFTGVWVKVERAKEHVRNLEALIEGFWQSKPYEVISYDEPETVYRLYKVKVSAQPPLRWSAIVGDAIHNLRSSLDLLVCELVRASGKQVKPNTSFPMFKNDIAYANAFKSGSPVQVKGAPDAVVDLIKAAKPYNGGNDALWRLHQLDIADKHKLLIAVGSAYRNFIIDVSAFTREYAAKRFGIDPSFDFDPSSIPPAPLAIRPADRLFPLKDGAELFRGPQEVDMNPQFTFEIAFGEGEIVQGEPLFPTLYQLVEFVEGFIKLFPPLFEQESTSYSGLQ